MAEVTAHDAAVGVTLGAHQNMGLKVTAVFHVLALLIL